MMTILLFGYFLPSAILFIHFAFGYGEDYKEEAAELWPYFLCPVVNLVLAGAVLWYWVWYIYTFFIKYNKKK